MKTYKLSVSCEPNIIGVNNGITQGNIKWKKFNDTVSEDKIMDYFSLEKFIANQPFIVPIDFKIEHVEAYKSAKMTDFFMYSPHLFGINYFISYKTLEVLKDFNLPIHIFIPVNIYHKDKKYEYFGLYFPFHYREDVLDFSKSIFYEGSFVIGKTFIKFENSKEYKNFKGLIWPEKLKFNSKVDRSLDLFDTMWGGSCYFISERLKIAIEEAGLTGVVIREPKEPELIFE